jgi:hypothetical protein
MGGVTGRLALGREWKRVGNECMNKCMCRIGIGNFDTEKYAVFFKMG